MHKSDNALSIYNILIIIVFFHAKEFRRNFYLYGFEITITSYWEYPFFFLDKLFKDPLFHPCTNHMSRHHFLFEDKNKAGKV